MEDDKHGELRYYCGNNQDDGRGEMMKKKTPARLHKKVEKKPILSKANVIQIGIVLGIVLLLLIFFLICFIAVPKTFGFFWW